MIARIFFYLVRQSVVANPLLHLSSVKSTYKMKSILIEIVSDGDPPMPKSVESDEQQISI